LLEGTPTGIQEL